MQRVPFAKLSPNGNTTILLRGEFSPQVRAALSVAVMQSDHLCAEQAGAVTFFPPRLDMMGGEFCLNATRAFAALLAFEGKLKESLEGLTLYYHGHLETSGLDTPVAVRVKLHDEATALASVRLHLPPSSAPECPEPHVCPGVWLVRLPGIQHLLVDVAQHHLPLNRDALKADSARWRNRFGLESQPAAGVIYYELPKHDERHMRIVPVVWVALTGGVCVETACGSGSLAAALVGAAITGMQDGLWSIEQAGGTLDVSLTSEEVGFSAWVGGEVRYIAEGHTFIALPEAIADPETISKTDSGDEA